MFELKGKTCYGKPFYYPIYIYIYIYIYVYVYVYIYILDIYIYTLFKYLCPFNG